MVACDIPEVAYQFTACAPEAMWRMTRCAVEAWLSYATDLYDTRGQMPANEALRDIGNFADHLQERLAGLALKEVAPVLERFVCGLKMSERVFTRLHREQRHIAVMLVKDMSGST